jgi:hypothetical protein
MTTINQQTRFFITLLETRKQSLKEQIAGVGRWDPTFDTLAAELLAVEHELEGIYDDTNNGEH